MPLANANGGPINHPRNAPTLTTSLTFDLELDETSGTRADSSGNALDFTANGTIGSAAGKRGNAISGSGSAGAYLSRASSAALVTGDIDFWVALWWQPASVAADQGLISKWATNNQEYALWYNNATGLITFSVSSTGSNATNQTSAQTYTAVLGAWYLIQAWHDSVNNLIGIMVNNGYTETTSYSSGVFASGTADVTIGAKGTANPVNGLIDMARFWKKAPSDSDLMAVWDGGRGDAFGQTYNPNTRQIVFIGNSLTYNITLDPTNHYPTQCMALLGQTNNWTWRNWGLAGRQTSTMQTTTLDALYRKWVDYNVLVVWEITNELNAGIAAATALSNYTTYCTNRRAVGWKVIAVTVLPRTSASGTFEADRQTVNTSIRAGWTSYADALADVAADSRIGDAGDQNDLTYYLADAIHLTTAGAAVVAGIVTTAITGLG